jgi:hypothetical protein
VSIGRAFRHRDIYRHDLSTVFAEMPDKQATLGVEYLHLTMVDVLGLSPGEHGPISGKGASV